MTSAHILIAEDEVLVATDLRDQLRRLGYRTGAIVRSGDEAVRWTINTRPDLVLMDVRLEGMDGLEAARWIESVTQTPIIYLTGFPGVFISKPEEMLGAALCLTKPVRMSDLQAVIEIVLRYCAAVN